MESKAIKLPTAPPRPSPYAELSQLKDKNSEVNTSVANHLKAGFEENRIYDAVSANQFRGPEHAIFPQPPYHVSLPIEADICFSDKYHAHIHTKPNLLPNAATAERSMKLPSAMTVPQHHGCEAPVGSCERQWQARLLQVQAVAAAREQSLKAQRNQLQLQIDHAAVREALLEARLRSV